MVKHTNEAAVRTTDFHHQALNEFDRWAESYDRSILQTLLFRPSYRAMLAEVSRWRAESGARCAEVLDVGTGTGTFIQMLIESNQAGRAVGVDFSPNMCAVAHDKAARLGYGHRAEFVNADSENMPFEEASFDIVTCANSFHHYPNQAAAVREMFRVLRPGGRLVLVDGFRDVLVGRLIFDVGVAAIEKNVHHASGKQFRRLFKEAGFADIRQFKFNFLPPLLATVGEVGR